MKNTVKTAIIITIITTISKFVGFFREVVFASSYGADYRSDAFLLALSIAGLMTVSIFSALRTTYLPVYSEVYIEKNSQKIKSFVNSSYTLFTLIIFVICVLSFLFSRNIILAFSNNLPDDTLNLTTSIFRIVIFSVLISALIELNNARLQVHNSFFISPLLGFVSNMVMIIAIIFYKVDVIRLAYVFFLGILLQFVLQVFMSRNDVSLFRLNFKFRNEHIKKLIVLSIPIMIGSVTLQVNTFVDKYIATGFDAGSVSALNYSFKLVFFITSILAASITTVFFTKLTIQYNSGNYVNFSSTLSSLILYVVFLLIPICSIMLVNNFEIIKVIYQRGGFNEGDTTLTSAAFFAYSIGLIAYSLREVYSRAFYAIKQTKSVMVNGVFTVLVNIILSLILSSHLGVVGIAFATSISSFVSLVQIIISFRLQSNIKLERNHSIQIVKYMIISVITISTSFYVRVYISAFIINSLMLVAVLTLVTGLIYLFLLLLFGTKEIYEIYIIIKKYIGGKIYVKN